MARPASGWTTAAGPTTPRSAFRAADGHLLAPQPRPGGRGHRRRHAEVQHARRRRQRLLDRDETAERIRFERELFELIDADGDEKIFADEMKQYVRRRASRPPATCRINLYDTGYGFFMALDAQRRRPRLGAREAAARRPRWPARPRRQAGHPRERAGAAFPHRVRPRQLPAVRPQRAARGRRRPRSSSGSPTGPIWFQRMDRNNDGDLIWNEFLGPR